MRVSKISITNILGIEGLEIAPGTITCLSGANGAGKTSVIEAVRSVLSGGHDATLLRNGATEGEVVLVLDDDTTIRRRVTEGKSDITVSHPQFGKISKPAAYIKKLADALSLNPIQFLTAPKKQRVDILLEAIPMKVTAADLGSVPMVALKGIDLDAHALEVIGAVSKSVYDLRTGVNRSATDKRSTIRQMSATLPPAAPEGDWNDVLTATTGEWQALHKATSAKLAEIEAERITAKEAADEEAFASATKVREDLQAAIDKLKAEANAEIARLTEGESEACERADAEAKAKREAEEAAFRPKEAELKEAIGHARAMVEQQAQAEKAREYIATLTDEAGQLEAESAKLTDALSGLNTLKASLLKDLPIEGLSVQDGEIFIDGVPFDRVNTAERVSVAIQVAGLRAGELGLVAVDGLECLDSETFKEFQAAAEESGLQFVISKVTDGPLTISTEEVA